MTVMITAIAPPATPEEVQQWEERSSNLRSAKGFLFHANGPAEGGGTQITEFWESIEDCHAYFKAHVLPHLPAGTPADGGMNVQEIDTVYKP
jgi:hypothetical protein